MSWHELGVLRGKEVWGDPLASDFVDKRRDFSIGRAAAAGGKEDSGDDPEDGAAGVT